jgi:hypothetical protein
MLRIGISYLICIPRTESRRLDGSSGLLHQWKRGLILFLEQSLAFLAVLSHLLVCRC